MKHRQILNALRACESSWIKRSAENPNKCMSKLVILLHYVVLRERGAL